MATQENVRLAETSIGDLTVGQFKILVKDLMREQLMEILEEFENYLPEPETGWTVKPEVWAQLRDFIKQERENP